MGKHTLSFLAGLLIFGYAAAAPAQAALSTRVVEYRQGNVTMKGLLVYDGAVKGRRPAVIVVHEWWGLNEYARMRAEMLAKLGYVAFAADMYGQGQMTTHASEAKAWAEQVTANIDTWRSRALKALEVVRAQPEVDPTKVAAIGYCFGGATVMHMAYAGADLRGVASFHGSLPPAEGVASGSIKAKILAAHGAADSFVPAEKVHAFQTSLEHVRAVWEFVTYSQAKHSFTNPEASKAGMEGVAYDKRADTRSWELLQSFLKEVFAGT